MRNVFLKYDPESGIRCEKCLNHTYLVYSIDENLHFLHTRIEQMDYDRTAIYEESMIHWWRTDDLIRAEPECFKKYKEVK